MTIEKKAAFLTTTYSAYSHRDVPTEDVELTHVGPGTPCGEYMRRFWQPLPIFQEPTDLPIRFRLLGEDLVVFRDKSGHVGVLELHCSHRGTSLEFGRIEEHGIRCCYHGWQFDVDGRILDTPGEPPESTFKDRLCHGAYPVQEYEGLIFTYMGPPGTMPPFPNFSSFKIKGYHRWVVGTLFLPARRHTRLYHRGLRLYIGLEEVRKAWSDCLRLQPRFT